jgi:hypothetical protein
MRRSSNERRREQRLNSASTLRGKIQDELEQLLREVPEDGQQRAKEIYRRQRPARRPAKGKRASPSSRLKALAREIYEKWERVWEQTNNATERIIGQCLKIRSKQMRGFKQSEHIRGFALLRGWMYCQGDRVELGCLL